MGRFVRILAVLAGALLLPATVLAQASITGVVRDTSGGVLPGVTVEAASPVLIEKVRTTVTDGNGRFQIVDLRPGAYTVTFSLTGFNTVKRDGINLAGSVTSAVDAELRVGALEETITVTGEAPVVDVQSATRQAALSADTIDALPTARNYLALARLIPGTVGGGNDVGGSETQGVGGSVQVHGSRPQDQRITLNGVPTQTLQAGGHLGGQVPDVATASEVTIDHTAVSAELPTGGIRINFIPRDGGNTFSNSTFFTFSNGSLQGSNFSDELRAAGLTTPDAIKKNWDLNVGAGGPVRRDKLWFWFSGRYNGADQYAAVFENKNAFDPTKFLYEPDTSKRGVNSGRVLQSSLRMTWQASPRNKIAGTYKVDRWCNCLTGVSPTTSPEAAGDFRFPRLTQTHGEWTSPVTNRLLLEAVGLHLFERWGFMHPHQGTGTFDDPAIAAVAPQLHSILEQTTGMTYGARAFYNNTLVPNFAYRAAAAYVTGTHNIKVGFNRIHGFQETRSYSLNNVAYRFNNGVPNLVTLRAFPVKFRNHQDNDLGIYAQDRWTLNRFTVNLALRYDTFNTSFPEQRVGPAELAPTRDFVFAARDNLGWKDITYRSGLTYDVRGNGRTALKVTFNKYLRGQTLNILGTDPNPVNTLVNVANRSWTDANRNFTPDCDLIARAANGECGPIDNPNFGSAIPGASYDKELLTGWGNRERNWEFSAGVQHELLPRVSLDVGYFRRIWGNFQVADDLALGAGDFDTFSMTVPKDSRLPGGGGYTLEGLRALKPSAFGRPTQNFNTLSRNFGTQIEHWNGVDVNINSRLQNGLTLQLGTSTGKTTEDDCEIVAGLPEALNVGVGGPPVWQPAGFCHRETPWLTAVKGYAVYTIPRVEVQVSGTFRSSKEQAVNANFVASNAYLAANSTLGRPLAGGAPNITVNLIQRNSLFLDRRNELDLRFGKLVRVGRSRSVISVDLYNALNTDAVLTANESFARWLSPTSILKARVAKISVQFDF